MDPYPGEDREEPAGRGEPLAQVDGPVIGVTEHLETTLSTELL